MQELGHSADDCQGLYPGGETEALDRMELHLKKIVSSVLNLISICANLECLANLTPNNHICWEKICFKIYFQYFVLLYLKKH